jgi:hypothetical protein
VNGIKMSKMRDLMDISEGEPHQNVQEKGFIGHFGRVNGIKMSKKRVLMDISEGEPHQNVQKEGFIGHFGR